MTNEPDFGLEPTITGAATSLWHTLNSIYNVTDAAYLIVACLVVGYVLKSIKPFPNTLIPVSVVIVGLVGSIFLQPDAPSGIPHKAWNFKNGVCGLALGFLTWRFHKGILSKLDDLIYKRFGIKADANGNGDSNPPFKVDRVTPPPLGTPPDVKP